MICQVFSNQLNPAQEDEGLSGAFPCVTVLSLTKEQHQQYTHPRRTPHATESLQILSKDREVLSSCHCRIKLEQPRIPLTFCSPTLSA